MKKNKVFSIVLSLAGAFAVTACGSKANSNMLDSSENTIVSAAKWDQFATAVGIPTTSQAASATDMAAVMKNLSTPPANFQPSTAYSPAEYAAVVKAVNAYVGEMAPNTQAISVTSIQNYGTILTTLNFEYTKVQTDVEYTSTPTAKNSDCKTANFYSIPFVDRNGCTVDLSANLTLSGVDPNGKFKIYGTKNGLLNTAESASGKVYVVTYKLNELGVHKYTALITIPDLPSPAPSSPSYPLMMFAHGGDAGLSFRNIATVVQKDLGRVILAATNYPGEPICPITQKMDTSAARNFQRSCVDNAGNIVAPAVAADGQRSPLNQDVTAFLGLQNAISNLALETQNDNVDFKMTSATDPDDVQAYLKTNLKFYLTTKSLMPGPQTIGAAESRGGGVLLAAMGREGIMFNNMFSGLQDFVTPVLFSSAVLYFPPTSMLVGKFRLVTQYLMAGNITDTSSLNAIPMVPDLKKNKYFTSYKTKKRFEDKAELNSLIGWVGATDVTYLAPYVSVSTQNWGKSSFMQLLNSPIVLPYFNDLSIVVPDTTQNKSLFNYFADAISNTPASDTAQCEIETLNGDCTVRGLFLKGLKGGNLDLGGESPVAVPNIPALLKASDADSIQGLVDFLNTLGNQHDGSKALIALLTKYNQVNFITKDKKTLLPALISVFGFSSMLTGTDPYIQNLPEGAAVYTHAGSQVFAHDFAGADGNTNAIEPNKSILARIVASPGSVIFLHGTQDAVVPFTESLIAKTAADAVFDNVYGTLAHLSPLVQNGIPAVGTQMYSFQPDDDYYNLPVGTQDPYGHVLCASVNEDGKPSANYNPTTNKCFGNFRGSMKGDGNFDHGDSAFYTSHLLNGAMRNMNVVSADASLSDKNSSPLYREMRYGADTSTGARYVSGTASEQLDYLNAAHTVNGIQGDKSTYPYNSNVDCTDSTQITGVCYLAGFLDANGVVTSNKIPLFNRTMYQDETQNFAPMYTGAYDSVAQTAGVLAPTDIFSTWLDAVVLSTILNPNPQLDL